MERRLVTFIVASTAFFIAYMSLRAMFGPPPIIPDRPDADDAAIVDEWNDATPDVLAADSDATDAEAIATADRPKRAQWSTLGSMDAASNHVMLVTLTNVGSGLERIELTERDENGRLKYRRVDVRSGYMGYIAGTPDDRGIGVRVNVVGPGTPISQATSTSGSGAGAATGIAVGDVIVAVNNQAVSTPDDIDRALFETEPGKIVLLEVERPSGSDAASTIVFEVKLSEHPLDLVRLASTGGADEIDGNLSRLSCLMSLAQVNRKKIDPTRLLGSFKDPAELFWNMERGDSEGIESADFSVELTPSEMESVGAFPVRLKRSYSLRPGEYSIDMTVQVDNLHSAPQRLSYRLEGVNGITLEGWWYSNKISPNFRGGAAARDIVFKKSVGGHQLMSGFDLLSHAKSDPAAPTQNVFTDDGSEEAEQLRYVGVDAQYFTVAYLPPADADTMSDLERVDAGVVADADDIPRHKERAVNVSFALNSELADVPASGSVSQTFRIFAGPKNPELLEQYGLGECVYYGWFWWAAQFLANMLHGLYWVIGNYAVSIVLLTVIVRGFMFPLSRKAAINAQRMQELAPEMKKIAEKYKDDMEGRLRAQRELQARVGFNPMAGCLPMFAQLPIFIGLYRALSVDIELRQAAVSPSLQWASNLAGPDMLYYWGDWMWDYLGGRGTGWLGPYFNLLPIIVVGLFLTQQKLFMPPATDEQQVMTQKVMNVMTLMMGLFFFRVPAGLCIYFITSSLWGICERILVKKTIPEKKHFDAGVLEGTATPTARSGKPSFAQMIQDKLNPPEEPIDRPNKRRRPPAGNTKKKR